MVVRIDSQQRRLAMPHECVDCGYPTGAPAYKTGSFPAMMTQISSEYQVSKSDRKMVVP
jgi:hypothetical protein